MTTIQATEGSHSSSSSATSALRGRRHHHGHHQTRSTPSAPSSSSPSYSATASLRSRSSLLWGRRRPTRMSPHRSSSSRSWWVGQKKFMFTLLLLPVSLLAIAGICLLRQYRHHRPTQTAQTPFKDPHYLAEDVGDTRLRRNRPITDTSSAAPFGGKEEERSHPIGLGGNLPVKQKRALLVWPTIPVPLKGSDARPLDAIRYLSSPSSSGARYSIDLLFWRDYATESRDATYDDSPDRERLVKAGVERILGPYDDTKLSDSHTYVGGYDLLVYWLWPDVEFLDCVIDAVEWVKGRNGATKVVAVVDDVGVAARYLIGEVGGENGGGDRTTKKVWTAEDVEGAVLAKRPLHLLGNETTSSSSTSFTRDDYDVGLAGEVDGEKLFFGTRLLYQEMHLYVSCSDVVVGVNSAATAFLRKMVPGVPVFRLSYVSPVQPEPDGPGGKKSNDKPFHERENGYVFFGYNNFANNRGLGWFLDSVLPRLANSTASTASEAVLHVAGTVTVPEEYCTCDGFHRRDCTSHQPTKVVCHGAIGDGELDALVSSVRVAINPVLEPSGVATKTCRAMALGTPVVVTDLDGTFVGVGGEEELGRGDREYERSIETRGGRRCTTGAKAVFDGKGGADDDTVDAAADCFAMELSSLLSNEAAWTSASSEAPVFIVDNFGLGRYEEDWSAILKHVEKPLQRWEVVIDPGENVVFRDGDGMSGYSWHLAHELSAFSDLRVTVVTNAIEPTLPGVHVATPHVLQQEEKRRRRLLNWSPWSWLPGYDDNTPPSPSLPTGFQANVIIRVKPTQDHWSSSSIYPLSFCGTSCRVVQILSSSYGTLPESWLASSPLSERVDALWVPSARDRTVHEKCGLTMERSHIVPVGIDCEALFPLGSGSASAVTSNPLRKDGSTPSVTFLFFGDFAPRTGIDVLLEEWERLFCGGESFSTQTEPKGHQPNAKLILLTGNEEVPGFSDWEVAAMERISDRCRHTVRWERRSQRMERRPRFVELLGRRKADVYIAPSRSSDVLMDDGVVSVMEARAMDIPVIVSSGVFLPLSGDDLKAVDPSDTAGNTTKQHAGGDSRRGHETYYRVKSKEVACRHEPCRRGRRLCDFPPCHSSTTGCVCERVVVEPTWFEMDREDLRIKIGRAHADVLSNRQRKATTTGGGFISSSAVAKPFCREVGVHFHEKTLSSIKGPLLRKPPSFFPPDPPLSLRLRRIVRFFVRKVVFQLVTLSVVLLFLLSRRFPRIWNLGIRLFNPIPFNTSGPVTRTSGRRKVS